MTPGEFRRAHAANPEQCCAGCLGWCISVGSDGINRIERCDGCWYHHDNSVTDNDAAQLPEARAALSRTQLDAAS